MLQHVRSELIRAVRGLNILEERESRHWTFDHEDMTYPLKRQSRAPVLSVWEPYLHWAQGWREFYAVVWLAQPTNQWIFTTSRGLNGLTSVRW